MSEGLPALSSCQTIEGSRCGGRSVDEMRELKVKEYKRCEIPDTNLLKCHAGYENSSEGRQPLTWTTPGFIPIKMSPLPEEFDIIVCGGGSCGCVVAGR